MKIDEIRSRDDLPQFFLDCGFKIGAEIGVYKGEFTEKLCYGGMTVFGIDPYIVYDNYRKHPKEEPYEALYQQALNRVTPLGGFIVRKTSIEAAKDFADGSLDFVYIDGNHSLPYVAQDIFEWSRKVRAGGVVAGHDYFNDSHNPYWIRACHVRHAVDACVQIFKVDKLYVVGAGRDKCPSWLWIKQ